MGQFRPWLARGAASLVTLACCLAGYPAVAAVMIPAEVKLVKPTPADAQAHAIWSLRAALNVAALQCQFSPFLGTVRNYNDFLRQHSDDLAGSLRGMTAHYGRTAGAKNAQRLFDSYTTRTYQSYSTIDAQRVFCEQAGITGRRMLQVRKGQLGPAALAAVPELRTSLIPPSGESSLTFVDRNWVAVPDACADNPRMRECRS